MDRDAQLEAFADADGEVPAVWRDIRELSPEFFDAYAKLAAVPLRRGALTPKVRALVMVAINAAVTHLHKDGIRQHIRAALHHGASGEEILEVLQLVSVLGIHAISLGFPAARDMALAAGRTDELPPADLDAHQQTLKDRFREKRGYWSPFWEEALKLDPLLFEAYFGFSSVPWEYGVLEPKVREFVYVAIDASTTHMFDEGTRGHMANAFKQGASLSEILEVLELAVTLGIQSMTDALPILQEELAAFSAAGA